MEHSSFSDRIARIALRKENRYLKNVKMCAEIINLILVRETYIENRGLFEGFFAKFYVCAFRELEVTISVSFSASRAS